VADEVRRAAYEIIARKGATNHAIGLVTAAFLRSALRDEHRVLTVSRVQDGALGVRGIAISLPGVVGRQGVTEIIEPDISADEKAGLEQSVGILREAAAQLHAR
jgi:L-lactate dehydrogenase